MKTTYKLAALITLVSALILSAQARNSIDETRATTSRTAANNAYCNTFHSIGKIALGVSNDGTIGTNLAVSGSSSDCFTNAQLPSCEFPKESGSNYLFGGVLWVGAIVGQDTLVSTGADGWSTSGNEFHPEEFGIGDMIHRSNIDPSKPWFEGAISQEDYIAVYYDTCTTCFGVTNDPIDRRGHWPLGLKVTQSSYAWSHSYAEDFVIFDYVFESMVSWTLNDMYIGFYIDADIHNIADGGGQGAQDDISGFIQEWDSPLLPENCRQPHVLGMGWSADNDGDMDESISVKSVTGLRPLFDITSGVGPSFNWWISNGNASLDFGPMKWETLRDFGTGGTGTPEGDRNKYHQLSNGSIDYDQAYVGTIGALDPVWLPPPVDGAQIWAAGLDTRYLLSFGPFTLAPGESLNLPFAYVAGEDFHTVSDNTQNLPNNPDAYYDNLGFSDLISNAILAEWVYDNPGIDTDSDGHKGEFVLCNGDTIWTKGDGIPDRQAGLAPAAPTVEAEALSAAIKVTWNGHGSETSFDPFSREFDFEGYKVYLATDPRHSSFSEIAVYDIEDFSAFRYSTEIGDWEQLNGVYPIRDLRCLYSPWGCDDVRWHPLQFPRSDPFVWPADVDTVIYWEQYGPNTAEFGLETPVLKSFPEAAKPPYSSPAEVPVDSAALYLTEDGLFKYYQYELTMENLIRGEEYWVSVTAYDFGSQILNAQPLESARAANAVNVTPLVAGSQCCVGQRGNVNGLGGEKPTVADISALVDLLFMTGTLPPCLGEADVNQSGGYDPVPADISVGDIGALVDHLFITGEPLPDCL